MKLIITFIFIFSYYSLYSQSQEELLNLLMSIKDDTTIETNKSIYRQNLSPHKIDYKKAYQVLSKIKNIDIVNKKGKTPLMLSCEASDINTHFVKKIFERTSNKNIKDKSGNTFFALCIKNPNTEIELIEYFLANGLDINTKSSFGNTLLHLRQNPEEIKKFIKKGADLNLKNFDGNTPLNLAIYEEKIVKAELFINNKSEINKQNNTGNTPLHLCWNIDLIRELLKNGANISIKNNLNQSPLEMAFLEENFEKIKFIVEYSNQNNVKIEDQQKLLNLSKMAEKEDIYFALQGLEKHKNFLKTKVLWESVKNNDAKTAIKAIKNEADTCLKNIEGMNFYDLLKKHHFQSFKDFLDNKKTYPTTLEYQEFNFKAAKFLNKNYILLKKEHYFSLFDIKNQKKIRNFYTVEPNDFDDIIISEDYQYLITKQKKWDIHTGILIETIISEIPFEIDIKEEENYDFISKNKEVGFIFDNNDYHDPTGQIIKLWLMSVSFSNPKEKKLLKEITFKASKQPDNYGKFTNAIQYLLPSENEKYLLAVANSNIFLVDLKNLSITKNLDETKDKNEPFDDNSYFFSNDAEFLFRNNSKGKLLMYDCSKVNQIRALDESFDKYKNPYYFSSDNSFFVWGNQKKEIQLLNLKNYEQKKIFIAEDSIQSINYYNSKILITTPKKIEIFDIKNDKLDISIDNFLNKQNVVFIFDDNIKDKDSTKTIINLRHFSFLHQKIFQNDDKILSARQLEREQFDNSAKISKKHTINFDEENMLLVDINYTSPFYRQIIIEGETEMVNHTSFKLINRRDTTTILKEFEVQYGEPTKIIIAPNRHNFITYNTENGIQYWNKKEMYPIRKISDVSKNEVMFFPNGDKLLFKESENTWKVIDLGNFKEVCKIIVEDKNIIFITPDLYSFGIKSNTVYLINGMNSNDIKKSKNKIDRFDVIIEKLGLLPLPSNHSPVSR
ncbi:MAG: ankyrin repeat domain-containing protein [Cytophagia bacterium]|nr:MAG: ankyrin repeat domain-containing protein [Cytophagia bacterium]TAG42910.1 MAG: ankyrin repeat domain-containing protein [Cytophagia bacterium]